MIDGFLRAGNRFFDMINASQGPTPKKESWAYVPAEVLDRHGAGFWIGMEQVSGWEAMASLLEGGETRLQAEIS